MLTNSDSLGAQERAGNDFEQSIRSLVPHAHEIQAESIRIRKAMNARPEPLIITSASRKHQFEKLLAPVLFWLALQLPGLAETETLDKYGRVIPPGYNLGLVHIDKKYHLKPYAWTYKIAGEQYPETLDHPVKGVPDLRDYEEKHPIRHWVQEFCKRWSPVTTMAASIAVPTIQAAGKTNL